MQRDRVNCGFGHDDKAHVDDFDRVNNYEDAKKYDDRKEG